MSAIVEMSEREVVLARVKNISCSSAYVTTSIHPDTAAEVSVRFFIGRGSSRAALELLRLYGKVIRSDPEGCAIVFHKHGMMPFEQPGLLSEASISGGVPAAAV